MRTLRLITTLSFLLMASCASTRVAQSWRDPEFTGKKFQKVLVIAMVPDETPRRNLEQDIVNLLNASGINASPSTGFFPTQKEINPEAVHQLASSQGFDGLVISRFRGIDYRLSYSPGYSYYYFPFYDPWYAPGYAYAQPEARIETMLFEVTNSGRLVWSALTETVNPSSARKQTEGLAKKIVERMEKDGVVPAAKKK